MRLSLSGYSNWLLTSRLISTVGSSPTRRTKRLRSRRGRTVQTLNLMTQVHRGFESHRGHKKKEKINATLVSGVNGVGKSLIVELILKKHDYNIINLSMDDDRDKETINQTIKPLLKTPRTFNGQSN